MPRAIRPTKLRVVGVLGSLVFLKNVYLSIHCVGCLSYKMPVWDIYYLPPVVQGCICSHFTEIQREAQPQSRWHKSSFLPSRQPITRLQTRTCEQRISNNTGITVFTSCLSCRARVSNFTEISVFWLFCYLLMTLPPRYSCLSSRHDLQIVNFMPLWLSAA